ncbi:HNH endonuclease [Ensifer sp. SSB1]|uniref:HNH endonuclease n=1 Tax=Ensifer sp. SSB1 TaxID=2795385 RepID=UPI001A52D5FA|nr:HNH endonuclease [Ensifer sp. SSB1]
MWERDPQLFVRRYGVSRKEAQRFRCTAEHLVARHQGGNNGQANIVAACQFCNRARHRKKEPLSASDHIAHVRKRLTRGKWLPHHLHALFYTASGAT